MGVKCIEAFLKTSRLWLREHLFGIVLANAALLEEGSEDKIVCLREQQRKIHTTSAK